MPARSSPSHAASPSAIPSPHIGFPTSGMSSLVLEDSMPVEVDDDVSDPEVESVLVEDIDVLELELELEEPSKLHSGSTTGVSTQPSCSAVQALQNGRVSSRTRHVESPSRLAQWFSFTTRQPTMHTNTIPRISHRMLRSVARLPTIVVVTTSVRRACIIATTLRYARCFVLLRPAEHPAMHTTRA